MGRLSDYLTRVDARVGRALMQLVRGLMFIPPYSFSLPPHVQFIIHYSCFDNS